MTGKLINPNNLQTVKNYALEQGVSPSYIYKLSRDERMELVLIDGVYFVDKIKHPVLPTRKEVK